FQFEHGVVRELSPPGQSQQDRWENGARDSRLRRLSFLKMDEKHQHYWQSWAESEMEVRFHLTPSEFGHPPGSDEGPTRRDFLRATGFMLGAAAALSGCSRAPVEKVAPYTVQPEGIVAGRAEYYASVCTECPASCGLLVKVRDGRPVKLEGNPDHPISRGALCATGQASILGLYDSLRLTQPL